MGLVVGLNAPVQAQLFDGVDWFEREVGQGVVWRYYWFENLFGARQSVSYVEVDLDNPNVEVALPFLSASRQRISQMVPAQVPNAKAAINGSFFDTSAGGGGATTYHRADGVVYNSAAGASHFGGITLNSTGVVDVRRRPGGGWSALSTTTYPWITTNQPMLVEGGALYAINAGDTFNTARHPRTAVGLTADNKLIMLTVDGRTNFAAGMTNFELQQVMDELGCVDAFNLDGGGSTTLWCSGEPFSGVVNYPSDNGAYDHLGERACSNGVAVVSTAPTPAAWDGRVTSITYNTTTNEGNTQVVTVQVQNIGTQTWTAADTLLQTSRTHLRTSDFAHASWTSPTQPAVMTPATVATGATATFSFTIEAPQVPTTTSFLEHFALYQSGVGRFGPADNEIRLSISVEDTFIPGEPDDVIVVATADPTGTNSAWFTPTVGGWSTTTSSVTAPGCAGSGTRWASTYRSVAGAKAGEFAPAIPARGNWRVLAAWANQGLRHNPITYTITHGVPPTTSTVVLVDQTQAANTWHELGVFEFPAAAAGSAGKVTISNANIDVSGNMNGGAIKWEFVEPTGDNSDAWMIY